MKKDSFKTNYDIIKTIEKSKDLYEWLNNFSNENQIKGHAFEFISHACITFGVSSYKKIHMKKGDSRKLINEYYNLDNYNFIEGSIEGIADIKFEKEKINYLFSVKYFYGDNSKSMKECDIDSLETSYKNYENKIIGLIINNKKKLKKPHKKDRKLERYYELMKNTYDLNDINTWFLELKTLLSELEYSKEKIQNYLDQDKKFLTPYLHQYIMATQIDKKFKSNREILLDAICRCGKTFISGYYVIKYNIKRVLLITPRPTSTKESYSRLLEEYIDFNKYKKGLSVYENENDKIILDETNEYVFVVMSRQLIFDRKKEIDYSYFDLVILDESHKICSTESANLEINKMKKKCNKILHMTATSQIVRTQRCLSNEQIIKYGLNEIQGYKDGNIYSFGDKNTVNGFLKKYNKNSKDIIDYYNTLPNLKYYYCNFKKTDIEIDDEIYDEEIGFSFKKLFVLNRNKFKHERSILNIFNLLFGSVDKTDDNYIKSIEDTTDNKNKNTTNNISLCFLPYGIGLPIKKLINQLEKLLENSKIKENYKIISYYTDKEELPKNIVEDIENKRSNTDKKILVLLGGFLELGVSIDYADNVIMMNDFKNPDTYLQKIYRCLTENVKNGEQIKYQGNVIDFNPYRQLKSIYNDIKSNGNNKMGDIEILEYIIKKRMIMVNSDNFELEEIDINNLKEVYEQMKNIDILDDDLFDMKKSTNLENYNLEIDFSKEIKTELQWEDDENNENITNVKNYDIVKKIGKKIPKPQQEKIIDEVKLANEKFNKIKNANKLQFMGFSTLTL